MKFPVYLFLGYTVIEFPASDLRAFLNLANRENIRVLKLSSEAETVTVRILTKESGRALSLAKCACIRAEAHGNYGLPPFLARYKHRAGLIAGLILFIAAVYISPLFLWQVNVVGLERLSREDVIGLLRAEGVFVGAFSPKIDRQKVYTNILQNSEEISWLTVNIRGSSANVEIVERDAAGTAAALCDGANLIASKDGVIVDADVIRGKVIAAGGAVVRKGDLLVSGIVDMERFGTRYVCAEGNVFARVTDTVTFEIPFSDVQKNYGEEEARAVSISFFGKSINIFKKTSLYTENYDTISREESLPFLWFDTLPLSVFVESAIPYTEEMVTRTEDEARKLADEALERFFADNTTYTELLSADSSYTVTDNALIMQCSIEAIENIAAVSEFTVR